MNWGKKAAAEEVMEQVPYIILTIIVMAGVYFLLSYFSRTTVDVGPVQADTFFYRMIYEPGAMSYTDNGRVHPGIIEDSLFNSSHIDSMIDYPGERIVMARFDIIDRNDNNVRTAYYNQEWYERLEPVARAGLKGQGGARLFEKSIPVIYRRQGVDIPATMRAQMIIPN